MEKRRVWKTLGSWRWLTPTYVEKKGSQRDRPTPARWGTVFHQSHLQRHHLLRVVFTLLLCQRFRWFVGFGSDCPRASLWVGIGLGSFGLHLPSQSAVRWWAAPAIWSRVGPLLDCVISTSKMMMLFMHNPVQTTDDWTPGPSLLVCLWGFFTLWRGHNRSQLNIQPPSGHQVWLQKWPILTFQTSPPPTQL